MRDIVWKPPTRRGNTSFNGIHRDVAHGLLLSLQWVGVFVEIKIPSLRIVAALFSSAYPLVKRPVPCHAQIVKPEMWEPCPREECMKPLHKVLWSERPSSAARKDQIQVLPSDASLQSIFRLA